MFTHDRQPQRITNLHGLNTELMKLNPSISGLALSMLETKGSTLAMLDFVIAASQMTMYNGIKRGDILAELKPLLAARVIAAPITFTYDTHGDKHFPGGDPGTKFDLGRDWSKTTINAQLVNFITPLVPRIRRDANGNSQTYYLTEYAKPYTGADQLAIQVDFVPGMVETITYHGYPRQVTVFGLSRTLGGTAIPL